LIVYVHASQISAISSKDS